MPLIIRSTIVTFHLLQQLLYIVTFILIQGKRYYDSVQSYETDSNNDLSGIKKWPTLSSYVHSITGERYIRRDMQFHQAYIFSSVWQDYKKPYHFRYLTHELDIVCTTILNTVKASAINYFMLSTVKQQGLAFK